MSRTRVYSARDVTKTNTTSVDTFQSPNSGKIGTVFMGRVKYNAQVERKHTIATPFSITDKTTSLPKVAIIYQYVGIDQNMLLAMLKDNSIKGIVLAGLGDGNVRASRIGSGTNSDDYNNLDSLYGTIPADDLNPQKARILLMLSLMLTDNPTTIHQYFNTY